jgi:undecaprenyl phosphate N,N'-diacetylbacillosamine 1-phosphate transferase
MSGILPGGCLFSVIKRMFDVVASACVLIVLLPLFVIVAIAIKLDSKGPVFYMQERLGLHARPFLVYKFRSMHLGAEKLGVYELKGDPRVTRVGRILRPLSINELPQFLNILKGDMSLVGPRPVLPFHPWPLEEYTDAQKKRFRVRPGLTGWAAVNGRKNVQWERRLELDAEYVDRTSLAFDMWILLKTVAVVLSASDGYNTTETARRTDDHRG